MGSGSSKGASASSSASASGGDEARKGKGNVIGNGQSGSERGRGLLQRLPSSSCFRGFTPASPPPPPRQLESSKGGETGSLPSAAQVDKSDEDVSAIPKSHPGEGATLPSSHVNRDQDVDVLQSVTTTNTTEEANQSTNHSDRSQPHFGVNFGLSRAVSLGSSLACSILSSGLSTSANLDVGHGNADNSSDANISQQGSASTTGIDSTLDMLRDSVTAQARAAHQARRNLLESGNANLRYSDRRMGPQEPFEGSVRFSRTLSVGRLRDRVLRRTPFSDGLFTPSLLYDRTIWPSGNVSARQNSAIMQRTNSERSSELQLDSSTNMYNSDSSTLRETSNRDLLEHRSAILERRRIRSQVRALQRLGSRTSSRPGNSDEETNTRASISRIVMLAEALFEVLDEIHQQSAALSSRPSFPSIGSVPAPKEVVERLPVKVYRRSLKHQTEEVAQCYICLVEYSEGDCVRILPCNHEFHLTCVDKWLKEIHRVCPLCRGDVCRSNASSMAKAS
ncbi:hypothetical protein GUJ93_ZPchr0005g14985 [Zizania palustris]|uniref:RING-type domain-containing protein n=1 Tax=Zizania palustris TaxID=103762 RepID=A0A8J5VRN2_ZIZPA|nr:hypothetical protein GUJ93_ZPchr0005g14985 [Zizania palustris]